MDTSVTVAVSVAVVEDTLTETEVTVEAVVAFVTVTVFVVVLLGGLGGLGFTGGQSGKNHQRRPSSQPRTPPPPLCAEANGEVGVAAPQENLVSSRVVFPTTNEDVETTVGDEPGQILSSSAPVPFPETSCLRTAQSSQHSPV